MPTTNLQSPNIHVIHLWKEAVEGPFSVLLGGFYCITGLSLCEIHKIK